MDAVAIDRNEREIRGANVTLRAGNVVLYPDLYASSIEVWKARFTDERSTRQIAHVHGREEIKMVGGGRYDETAGMAMAGQCAAATSIKCIRRPPSRLPERVRVVRENNLDHFRLRVAHRPRKRACSEFVIGQQATLDCK